MTNASGTAQRKELIFAVTRVLGSTKVCANRGDENMFRLLGQYYSVAAHEVATAGGRVIKCMGDGILLTFPSDAPNTAVEALRGFQVKANDLWRQFDRQCQVQVKVGIGTLISGKLGAPTEERLDVIGSVLNSLIKAPWSDFKVSAELADRV